MNQSSSVAAQTVAAGNLRLNQPGVHATTMTTSTNTPTQFPISPDLAHSIGTDCAQEWIDRAPGDVVPPASPIEWRARCYADAVHDYEVEPDFLQLLAAWERGFDSTLHGNTRGADQCSMSAAIKNVIFHMALGLAMAGSMLLAVIAAGGAAIVLVLADLVTMIGSAA